MPATAHVFTSGIMKCMDGTIALLSDTIKTILTKSTYSNNRDHDFAGDLSEISGVSGYTGGFGGAGRKTLGSKTFTVDDANDWFYFDAADVSYGALGTGDTIGGQAAGEEITNDAASPIFVFNGCTNTPTNGSPVTFQFDSGGLFRMTAA